MKLRNSGKKEELENLIEEVINEPFENELEEAKKAKKTADEALKFKLELESRSFFEKITSNDMAKKLFFGICLFFLLGESIIIIFSEKVAYNSLGFGVGILIALAMLISLTYSIETVVSYDENSADGYLKKSTTVRSVLCLLALLLAAYFKVGNVLWMLAGVMTLKAAAYLQLITSSFKRDDSLGGTNGHHGRSKGKEDDI